MGSSDSIELPPLVPLILGKKVELSRLSASEAVALLRGFFAHLQPCHQYLPAKTIDELTKAEDVRPLRDRRPDLAVNHPLAAPVLHPDIPKREKFVNLRVSLGYVKWKLRDAHSESHRGLYWTSSGYLVVTSYYFTNEVGGTAAMDFVRASDDQLAQVFHNIDYLYGGVWMEIVTNTLDVVDKMVAERQLLVDSQRELAASASAMRDLFIVPTRPRNP